MPSPELVPVSGVASVLFYSIALLIVGSSLVVVYSRNIVYSGFALLGTFLGVAAIFALLLSDFVAITQLMVYVGGILVLILFAIMLTRQIGDVKISNRSMGTFQGTVLWMGLLCVLVLCFLATPWTLFTQTQPEATTLPLGNAFLKTYVLPFEIASIVLLAALIGAVLIARSRTHIQAKGESR